MLLRVYMSYLCMRQACSLNACVLYILGLVIGFVSVYSDFYKNKHVGFPAIFVFGYGTESFRTETTNDLRVHP